jgi:hypothetical protein
VCEWAARGSRVPQTATLTVCVRACVRERSRESVSSVWSRVRVKGAGQGCGSRVRVRGRDIYIER